MTHIDYDKNSIVLNNNFTSITFGVVFWLIFHCFIGYLIFFGNVIDWTQDKEWFYILQEEIKKSARFGTILVVMIVTNIMAFRTLYKTIKNPKKIIFKNKIIESSKNFNNLEKINIEDIKEIKKSIYPILVVRKGNLYIYTIASIFGLISLIVSFAFRLIIWFFDVAFLNKKPFCSKYSYFIIFLKNTNDVINFHILDKEEFIQVQKYFKNTLKVDIDQIDITYNISNTIKGVKNNG